MSSRSEIHLKRWLVAERGDRPEADREAEAALFELLESLPLLAPRTGFADRVLAQSGLAALRRRPVKVDVFASRIVRSLLAACLAVVTLGTLALPAVFETVLRLGGLLTFGQVVQGGIRLATEALVGIASALRLGEWVLTVGRALTLPLVTPQVSLALLACLIVSSSAFFVLRDLISPTRSWNYVDS
jgi:hypothetical protein